MTALTEGSRVDRDNFIHATPGSILASGSHKYLVLSHGYAKKVGDGRTYPLFAIIDTGYVVEQVGDWGPLPENVTTFKQRAYTVCMGAARENGVATGPVRSALQAIGARDDTPPLGVGMFVHFGDGELWERIRTKRGVRYGYGDPNHWEGYVEYDAASSSRVMGDGGRDARTMQVLAMDNPDTDRYLIPPTEEDAAEIARLREQMWEIGRRAKVDNNWCTAFEQAVGVLGVARGVVTTVTGTPASLPDGVPMVESTETGSSFEVGAVFEYACGSDNRPDYEAGNWNWTHRVAEQRPDGHYTRHLFGPNGGHWGGRRRVLWDGNGEMRIPITLPLMRHLPVGTRLSCTGTHYVKLEDGQWQSGDLHPVNESAFFGRREIDDNRPSVSWFITSLPGVLAPQAN